VQPLPDMLSRQDPLDAELAQQLAQFSDRICSVCNSPEAVSGSIDALCARARVAGMGNQAVCA